MRFYERKSVVAAYWLLRFVAVTVLWLWLFWPFRSLRTAM